MHEGPKRLEHLRDMRVEALRLMRKLARFRPRLIGSVWTGHVRHGSDIDIHIFCDSLVARHGHPRGAWPRPRSRAQADRQVRRGAGLHPHSRRRPLPLRADPLSRGQAALRVQELDHRQGDRARLDRRAGGALLAEDPETDLEQEVERLEDHVDRFELYRLLLQPLEGVKQSARYHPEGDALYHSLQVFELARAERPYDEEFLLAALLHDVGKAIDPADHVTAALQALEGAVSERTAGLIAHHMDAQAYRDGTLGARARVRLQQLEDFDDLMLLCACDRRGRVPGAMVDELSEVLDFLRRLSDELDAEA